MDEEIHLSFGIVHSSFGIAQNSPDEYSALNRDCIWQRQMTNEQ
jgi:hypothetical protein